MEELVELLAALSEKYGFTPEENESLNVLVNQIYNAEEGEYTDASEAEEDIPTEEAVEE